MIDVNDLDGLLELANDYVEDGLHFLTEPVSYGGLLILVERIIAAEKDAARYRWLRDEANKSITIGPAVAMVGCDGSVMMREHGVEFLVCSNELDAAIDEAMQCNK